MRRQEAQSAGEKADDRFFMFGLHETRGSLFRVSPISPIHDDALRSGDAVNRSSADEIVSRDRIATMDDCSRLARCRVSKLNARLVGNVPEAKRSDATLLNVGGQA